jgi:hypothetical protein
MNPEKEEVQAELYDAYGYFCLRYDQQIPF